MNVGLTRARRSLWLIGHMATLATSAPWTALLRHATASGALYRTSADALRPLLAAPPLRHSWHACGSHWRRWIGHTVVVWAIVLLGAVLLLVQADPAGPRRLSQATCC